MLISCCDAAAGEVDNSPQIQRKQTPKLQIVSSDDGDVEVLGAASDLPALLCPQFARRAVGFLWVGNLCDCTYQSSQLWLSEPVPTDRQHLPVT